MKKWIYIGLIATTAFSCSQEETRLLPAEKEIRLKPEVAASRVSGDEIQGYAFDAGDEIGLFVSATAADIQTADACYNVKSKYDGSAWEMSSSLFWTSEETGTENEIRGYYPYRTTVSSPENCSLTVSTDQSDAVKMQANDFLYARIKAVKTPDNEALLLPFYHKLVKVTFHFRFAGTYEQSTAIDDFHLHARLQADIDFNTGIVGEPQGELLSLSPCPSSAIPAGYSLTYCAILPPQQLFSAADFFSLTIKDKTLTYALDKKLESGYRYTFHVAVGETKDALSLDEVTIGNWNDGGTEEYPGEEYIYKIGDLFPDSEAPVGIVYRVKTSSRPGMILSLDQSRQKWATTEWECRATDRENGRNNMETVSAFIRNGGLTWANFPAFEWCRNKGSEWYMPATGEWNEIRNAIEAYGWTKWDQKITEAGGTSLLQSGVPGTYWSSTGGFQVEGLTGIRAEYYFLSDGTKGQVRIGGDGEDLCRAVRRY